MILSARRVSTVAAFAMISVATGCQQNTTDGKDRSTYTAARHQQLGSNIPQPDSADTTNTRFNPDLGNAMPTQTAHSGSGL